MFTNIIQNYALKKSEIRERLNDFKLFFSRPFSWFFSNNKMQLLPVNKDFSQRIFEELSFCILTANTSAATGMRAVDGIRDILMTGSAADIRDSLVKSGYRFPNVRAQYIYEAREKFRYQYNFDFKKILSSFDSVFEMREFIVREIKGLGYKEASHFLRNIGYSGLSILDKHILKTMNEYNIIKEVPKTLDRKKYLEYEQKFIEFSKQLNIPIDELDLLLWAMKNGQVMK
jgi:N-glycosylase/DNA lyase